MRNLSRCVNPVNAVAVSDPREEREWTMDGSFEAGTRLVDVSKCRIVAPIMLEIPKSPALNGVESLLLSRALFSNGGGWVDAVPRQYR